MNTSQHNTTKGRGLCAVFATLLLLIFLSSCGKAPTPTPTPETETEAETVRLTVATIGTSNLEPLVRSYNASGRGARLEPC